VWTLGERECSLQRRNQKVIEEAPSPVLTEDIRQRIGGLLRQAMRETGYVTLATAEFLMDDQKNLYFMEVNTRLQVEHPVTELVMGLDLVQWQVRIAAGERLPFAQAEFTPRGWAMECRITSEDAANGFLPSTGRIRHLHLPAGPGVRWDGGIEAGSEVGLHYDPMLAKLIVHAPTRELAIARMRRALLELVIDGVETSREFHLRVLEHADFRRGDISIQWLERTLPELTAPARDPEATTRAAIAAALLAHEERTARGGTVATGAPAASRAHAASAATGGWHAAARREALRGG
jgi:acetyl-CoA carboxylase biotin carboxylase subunit